MNGEQGELWRISPEGGAAEPAGLAVPNKYIYFLRVSPDGRRVAFSVGDNVLPQAEIWAMENF